jgi:ribonuclease P protein component
MQFTESLKKYQRFQLVFQNGRSYATKYLVMYVKKNGFAKNRLGIIVTKKVGNSVIRHRITRLVRESYRLHESVMEKGYDIVIVGKHKAGEICQLPGSYEALEGSFLQLCKYHHLLKFYFYHDDN